MKLINLKCPECNAELKVNPDREFIYCEYCGTKILLDKEEKITRTIDEAEIRKAEAEEKIKIKEIESDEKKHKYLLIEMVVTIIFIIVFFVLGNRFF